MSFTFQLRFTALARALLASVVASAALGCGGNIGTDARPAPPPEAPSATPARVYSSAEVDAASARCTEPHGTVERYATIDKLVQLLSGAWFYCPERGTSIQGRSNGGPRVGIELTNDGHFYWLSRDASGDVVRGRGITEIAGYEIEPPSDAKVNNVSFQIDVWYPDRSVMPTRVTFETGPRRMALQGIDGYFLPMTSPTGGATAGTVAP